MTVLAIHPGALGDLILFGRFLAGLGEQVRLVAGGEKGKLLAGLGVVSAAVDFNSLPIHEAFTDTPLTECRLPSLLGPAERLISCLACGEVAASQRLAALCGAGEATFLPVRPPEAFAGHLLDLWADLTGRPRPPANAWHVPDKWTKAARRALAAPPPADRPYLVVHPGAGSPAKCWPLERFTALARSAGPAVFVLGPVEQARWAGRSIESIEREFPTLLCPPLEVLAGVLAGAAAYVGNDSGVTHLAAAVGTPTVAIFAAGSAAAFSPIGPNVCTVTGESPDDVPLELVRSCCNPV